MQFTIYISPGFEQECQQTLEEIEINLVKANIRPGIIFPTDRQLGIYSSIRHPGKWRYHKATDINLASYNPNNIKDPFSFLKTLHADEIMQENEAQAIIKHTDSAQLILSVLKTKKFIPPLQLKALAAYKENVVKHIKTLPLEIKKEVIDECLDKF